MEKIPHINRENVPVLEKSPDITIEKGVAPFEALLEVDSETLRNAYFRGLGELVSSEIYEAEDYTKYWVNNERHDDESDRSAADMVREALKGHRSAILEPSKIQDYFEQGRLREDEVTKAMLEELGRISSSSKDKKRYVMEIILGNHLAEISEMEQSCELLAGMVPRFMDNIDFRIGSFRDGGEPIDHILEYLSKKTGTFNFSSYIPIWKNRIKYQIMPVKTIGLDIQRVLELEIEQPGISKVLISEFGLENLGRYPRELLLEQVENEGEDLPYGVIASSKVDFNNALHANSQTMLRLLKDMKRLGRTMRIVEFNGNIDLYRSLSELHKKYGDHNRMEFGLLEAHGNPSLIRTGGEDRVANNKINSFSVGGFDERSKKAFAEMRNFFITNATIILDSCSTGDTEGVGRFISDSMDIRVIAPTGNAAASRIDVINGEGLEFDVDFGDSSEGPVGTSVFENGKLVAT